MNFFRKRKEKKEIQTLENLKCKNCGNPYVPEQFGPNDYANTEGFCQSICITDYLLKREKIIDENLQLLTEEIENIDTQMKLLKSKVDNLDEKQKKVVRYLLEKRKKNDKNKRYI